MENILNKTFEVLKVTVAWDITSRSRNHPPFLSLACFYLLITGAEGYCCSWSHSMTHNKGTSLRRDLYLTTKHLQETDIHAPGGIRTCNPSKRATADPRLRPRGHCDWPHFRSQHNSLRPILNPQLSYIFVWIGKENDHKSWNVIHMSGFSPGS